MGFLNACTWNDELGHNQYRSVISVKPVAFPGAGGYLRHITNVLGNSGDPAFPVGVDELAQFRLDTRLAGKSPLYYFGKGQSRVTLALLGANNVTGVVAGNSVTFPNAWNNADLRLTIAGHRLQKEIFLRAGHPSQFQFRIDSHAGLDVGTLSTPDFRILDPVLLDPASVNLGIPLKWLVTTSGGKTILTVTLPSGDHAGKVLDPTFILQPDAAAGKDNPLLNGANATKNYGISTSMSGISTSRSLLQFDLSSIPPTICNSATGVLTKSSLGGAANWTQTVYSIAAANAAWIQGTQNGATALAGEPCWNARVADGAGGVTTAWAGSAGCSTNVTDYEAAAMGAYSGHGADAVGTQYSVVLLASRVQGWFGSPNTNYGIVISAADVGSLATSDHATPAYRPMLTVEWKSGSNVRVFRRGWRKI